MWLKQIKNQIWGGSHAKRSGKSDEGISFTSAIWLPMLKSILLIILQNFIRYNTWTNHYFVKFDIEIINSKVDEYNHPESKLCWLIYLQMFSPRLHATIRLCAVWQWNEVNECKQRKLCGWIENVRIPQEKKSPISGQFLK